MFATSPGAASHEQVFAVKQPHERLFHERMFAWGCDTYYGHFSRRCPTWPTRSSPASDD